MIFKLKSLQDNTDWKIDKPMLKQASNATFNNEMRKQ